MFLLELNTFTVFCIYCLLVFVLVFILLSVNKDTNTAVNTSVPENTTTLEEKERKYQKKEKEYPSAEHLLYQTGQYLNYLIGLRNDELNYRVYPPIFVEFADEMETASVIIKNTVSEKGTQMSSPNSGCASQSGSCINQSDLVDPSKRLTTQGLNLLKQWALGNIATRSAQGKNSDMYKRVVRAVDLARERGKELSEMDSGFDLLDGFAGETGDLISLLKRHIAYLKKNAMPKRAAVWSEHFDTLSELMDEYRSLTNQE